jgi:glycerol-3-phosphate acyltransferase PlsY
LGVFAAIFLLFVWTTRYVSVGSIAGFISLPIFFLVILPLPHPPASALSLLVGSTLLSALVIFMHRENLRRLRGGIENKFR